MFGYRLAWDLDEIALYTPLLRVEDADTADIAESSRTLRQFVQPVGRCHTCADEPTPRATSNPSVRHLRSPLPTADTKRTDAPVPPAADIGSSELTREPLGHQTCEPPSNDFQDFVLLRIVERFAVGFDELPQPIPGREDYGILITAESLVTAFSVIAQLASGGALEFVQLDSDTGRHIDAVAFDDDAEVARQRPWATITTA